jgi:hypothetical protein
MARPEPAVEHDLDVARARYSARGGAALLAEIRALEAEQAALHAPQPASKGGTEAKPRQRSGGSAGRSKAKA